MLMNMNETQAKKIVYDLATALGLKIKFESSTASPVQPITERQKEVRDLYATGLSATEIAIKLQIGAERVRQVINLLIARGHMVK
jgi:DNA-binding NarL/FixJ family response regulator